MRLIGIRMPDTSDVKVAVLNDGRAVPLSSVGAFWANPSASIASTPTAESLDVADVDVVAPVLPDARVICVGLNYRAHAAEGSFKDQDLPAHPTLFGRWTRSLSVGGRPAPVPAGEDGLDWEGEIAAYLGADLFEADADTARDAILGYSTFNDLTARRAQKLTSQWTLGKNADDSGPLGPIVTADEVGDLRDGLRVRTRVNGATVQDGNTRDMIFEVGEVLAFISQTLTLRAGDIICTGTPEGVGYARTPPWLLQPGDVVEVEVDRLGTLTTPVTAHDRTYADGRTG
jgi:2-keto-4-pentenoate hydratase/2-oxohepta-3-ene-1,7-dioic acid hydratase in catechol pathway